MKTLACLKSIVAMLTIVSVTTLSAQQVTSGTQTTNTLTKWAGTDVITNSQVTDDGTSVTIGGTGTIVPLAKVTIQTGTAIGGLGNVAATDAGLAVISNTPVGNLCVGIFSAAGNSSAINVGHMSLAEGNTDVNIGVYGEAIGIPEIYNVGVKGAVGTVSDGETGVITLPLVVGVTGRVEVACAACSTLTATDAYALEASWLDGGGTVTNGYGLFIHNVFADNSYGVYQDGADDDNVFRGRVIKGSQTITTGQHTDFQLSVDGKVIAKEYVATLNNWADFVFADDYKLSSIGEVEDFIRANKHLPGVPSAAEVSANGMNVAEMNATLLQKIEELTLYIIEQNKQIEELKIQVKQ